MQTAASLIEPMILVDTSVWIDHFRKTDELLVALLIKALVLIHPMVLGEIACGNPIPRDLVLDDLANLPRAVVAHDDEVLQMINDFALHGRGIG